MRAQVQGLRLALVDFFRNYPWVGWAGWIAFCVIALARVHPRRFAAAFGYYLDALLLLRSEQPLYDPTTLTDVNYWPSTLIVLYPVLWLDPTLAAAIVLAVSAAVFTWAAVALMKALLPANGRDFNAAMLAGLLLLINIPAAWYNFKNVQLQVMMTASMMAACAAMIRWRWIAASIWLFIAIMIKPLALVMVLLCTALCARMRSMLIAAIVAGALLPFAFLNASYLLDQYHAYYLKLWHIATAPPAQWIYQADFSTMLQAAGIVLPAPLSFAIRLAAALGTLALAWRVQRAGSPRAFALAVLVLAGCYLTLFGPRNEDISFLVLTPSITAVALLLIVRNEADGRGWLLIAAALVLGFVVNLPVDRVLKPAIVLVIYAWVSAQMFAPQRWRDIVENAGGEPATGTG